MNRLFFIIMCYFFVTTSVSAEDKIDIFVSILPQKYFVERIGGDLVNVSVMVGNGQNPASYEPTPRQMAKLDSAQLYFNIGVPFENIWLKVIEEQNEALKIVSCCEEIERLELFHHSHGDHHHHENNLDPHIWTSPRNVKIIAGNIKQALLTIQPKSENIFESNYQKFISELDSLDHEITKKLSNLDNRYFFVTHPSLGYYAQSYDLQQHAIEFEGKEPKAKQLAELIELSRSKKTKVIFFQKQFNNKSAKIFAREINAHIVEFDPLAEDYIRNMNSITNAIVQNGVQ